MTDDELAHSSMWFVLATLTLATLASAIQLSIEPHEEECFFENLNGASPPCRRRQPPSAQKIHDFFFFFFPCRPVRDTFTLEFQVKKGGFLDVDVSIEDPSGTSLHSAQRQNDGRVTLSAQSNGLHKFCFGNKFSSLTVKVIDFDIITATKPKSAPLSELDAARAEDVDGIQASLFQLGDGLEQVEKELQYYRGRLWMHHQTNESTNDRVVTWSTFESVMVIVVALWQVWYMRRFFEVRRAV